MRRTWRWAIWSWYKFGVTTAQSAITSTATNLTTNNDKTGYGLSAAAIQSIWDALTSALTTVGSIGKWIVDKLDVIVSTRHASGAAVASVTGNVGGNVTGSVGSVASGGISAASLATAAKQDIADHVLDRNMATGTDSGTDSTTTRTPRQALRVLRNRTAIAGGVATVTKEDDTTTSWTAAVTTAAGNPISEVNPT